MYCPCFVRKWKFYFLRSALWMEEHQLAFATGRRLLKLLVQRNAYLKIFSCFIFNTSCCNKQTIIHHAHFLIFYFWHFSDALYAQVHGKMEARALLTEAVSVGVFRRCCNSSDLGWRDQQTMAVLYHRRNNQQDCLMGFWIVFRIADICTGIGTLFQSDKQFFPWNALLVSSLSSKLNFFCCEQSRWCQPPGSFPSLALGSVIFRLSHI